MDDMRTGSKTNSHVFSIRFTSITRYAALVKTFFSLVILFTIAHYLYFFIETANLPLLDRHAFRQTQTAISAMYILEGISPFNYETPVLGYPWTIPFEAPIYQLSVAGLSAILAFDLDVAGRIVSAVYFTGALILSFYVLRYFFSSRSTIPYLFVVLMMSSPLYIFWSRSFMIETAAIFWGMLFLYSVLNFSEKPQFLVWILASISCALCALTKMTTWPAFVVIAGCFWLFKKREYIHMLYKKMWKKSLKMIRDTSLLCFSVLGTLLLVVIWIDHADALKSRSVLGKWYVSENMGGWNYGAWELKYAAKFWLDTVFGRILPATLGILWFVPLMMIVMRFGASRCLIIAALCILFFLFPMLIFTNLHVVHDYYQSANSLFLIAAAAISIGGIIDDSCRSYVVTWRAPMVICLALLVIVFQYIEFYRYYHKSALSSSHDSVEIKLSEDVKNLIGAEKAMVVFGVSWSSVFHYYSKRKGIAVSYAATEHILEFHRNSERYFGNLSLGAIVDCREILGRNKGSQAWNKNSDTLIAMAVSGEMDGRMWLRRDYDKCSLYFRPTEANSANMSVHSK